MEVYSDEAWKTKSTYFYLYSKWYARVVTLVVSLNSFDSFRVILVTRMKQLGYSKIVEENFNFIL